MHVLFPCHPYAIVRVTMKRMSFTTTHLRWASTFLRHFLAFRSDKNTGPHVRKDTFNIECLLVSARECFPTICGGLYARCSLVVCKLHKLGSTLTPYLFVHFANCANLAQMGVIPTGAVV